MMQQTMQNKEMQSTNLTKTKFYCQERTQLKETLIARQGPIVSITSD